MTKLIKCENVELTELEKLIVQSKFVGGFDNKLEKEFARTPQIPNNSKREEKEGLIYETGRDIFLKMITSTVRNIPFDLEKNVFDEIKKIPYNDFYNNLDSQMLLKIAKAADIDIKRFDAQKYDSVLGKEALPLVYHGFNTKLPISRISNTSKGEVLTRKSFEKKMQMIADKGILTTGVTCLTPRVDQTDYNLAEIEGKNVYALITLPYEELYKNNLIDSSLYSESLIDFDYSLQCQEIRLKKDIPSSYIEGIYYSIGDETSKSEDLQLQILTEIFRRQNPSYKLGASLKN